MRQQEADAIREVLESLKQTRSSVGGPHESSMFAKEIKILNDLLSGKLDAEGCERRK
jgi:hypothetical protein